MAGRHGRLKIKQMVVIPDKNKKKKQLKTLRKIKKAVETNHDTKAIFRAVRWMVRLWELSSKNSMQADRNLISLAYQRRLVYWLLSDEFQNDLVRDK